jgi:hypothetical protein
MFDLKTVIREWFVPLRWWQIVSLIKFNIGYALISIDEKRLLQENKKLMNKHDDSRCFIMGAGSSIQLQDIKKLKGEVVISVSNTFVHPEFNLIKPHYHIVPPLLESHGELYKKNEFVKWLKEMEVATGDAEMFFHIRDRRLIVNNGLFTNRVIHWVEYAEWDGDFNTDIDLMRVPKIGSVSELALTVAVYLGFDKIYLIGIDHDWFNGLFIYFYDHKNNHALKPDENNISGVDSEFQMRRHADIFKKYKYLYSLRKNIFNANATKNHYLDVFPKVDYESLFE